MQYPNKTIEDITKFIFLGAEKEELQPSDLVIVLGNDFIEGTVAEIYDLYQRGLILPVGKIILSGATGERDAGEDLECNRLHFCAVEKYGMPEEMFLKEPNALNAYQNFEFSKAIVEEQLGGFKKFEKILCIGNAFLMRRASMYAAKFGFPTEKMQYFGTVNRADRNIGPDSWWLGEVARNRVMAEVERIGKYYLTGDLSIGEGADNYVVIPARELKRYQKVDE